MENEASSLSEEATILIQRAIKTEFETQLLIQTLKQCHGPLALATEYCTDISEKLKFLASLLKVSQEIRLDREEKKRLYNLLTYDYVHVYIFLYLYIETRKSS